MAVEICQSVDPVSRVIFDTFGRTLDPEGAILPNYLTARNDLVEGHLRSKPELTSIHYVELPMFPAEEDLEWLRNILGQTHNESVQTYSNGGIRLSLHTFNRQ